MACLNSIDLIATPGRRYIDIAQPTTGTSLRAWLANCLSNIGWTVTVANVTTGSNPGTGFKATSAAVPWCASGDQPDSFVGRCKVWFYPFNTTTAPFQILTEFKVMNADETMAQPTSNVQLVPTTSNAFGNYAKYSYMFVGTPYDFKVFMLGVRDRVTHSISNSHTAVLAGTPQMPSFVQARSGWCGAGVDEMFYLIDASAMRLAGPYNDNLGFYCGYKGLAGTFMNNSVAGPTPSGRFGWFLTYGIGNGATTNSGYWVYDGQLPLTAANWNPLMWPPIIVWPRDPVHPDTTREQMGFLWDAVVLNKGVHGDEILTFDDKQFIAFNNNWQGALSPLRPPGTMMLRIA